MRLVAIPTDSDMSDAGGISSYAKVLQERTVGAVNFAPNRGVGAAAPTHSTDTAAMVVPSPQAVGANSAAPVKHGRRKNNVVTLPSSLAQTAEKAPPPPVAVVHPRPFVSSSVVAKETRRVASQPAAASSKPAAASAAADIKKPSNAYIFFCANLRPQIMELYPTMSFTETAKLCGSKWKAADDAARQPYEAMAADDKVRYANALRDVADGS